MPVDLRMSLSILGFVVVACAPPNAATPYPTSAPAAAAEESLADTTSPDASVQSSAVARYFDREVDLAPFLSGFPYSRFRPNLRSGQLFFYDKGETYRLMMLDVPADGSYDLASAKAISDVDWSKRSLWSIHHHRSTNTLWLHADAANDEKMNLWTLELGSGALTQVTFHDYTYGLGFSEDQSLIAYLPRSGTQAPFKTCLRIRDVVAKTEREIVCDDNKLKFTWSTPRFSPDNKEVFFNAQVQGDRNRVQLVRVALDGKSPQPRFVTNPKTKRNSPVALEGWVGDTLLYVANDDGFYNLYAYNRKKRRVQQLTRFKEDLTSAQVTEAGVIGVHRTPAGSTLVLIDPKSGDVLASDKLPGTADVTGAHGLRALVSHQSPDIVYEIQEVDLSKGNLARRKVVGLDEDLEQKIVACKATAVKIPTFDKDPKTNKPRELHAFLLEPRTPLRKPEHSLAMLTAFYGGRNGYSRYDQIMCSAGLLVVSAAVRGSSGFGREFSSLNDRDLGGDEIVDLFHVARWVEQRTGLGSRRIGVYGGSHGGYATMRALTFPPETNGHNDVYPFGFGMSHAGFSSIKTFYDATNIPDWVVLESGDPNKPQELKRMLDRSPLSHVERLRAPLLLTHGSQDWRVPVDESRQFAEAAAQLKRPVKYVEIEGQGHHVEGLDLQLEVFQARLDFLMAVAKAASHRG